MEFVLGEVKTEWDVVQFVKGIHYNEEDFVDGDIREHIEKYDEYKLIEVSVGKLEEAQYYIDEELIGEYSEMNPQTIPPVVLGYYEDGDLLTIDGGHRITVAKKLGIEKIKAFVAIKSSNGYPLPK